jgi:hypothetical protein
MANPDLEKKFILYDFNKSLLVLSGNSNTMTVTKIPVHVLEMEDVCFHDGSALLLLDAPVGSSEGGTSADNQKKVSGTDSLVLVFRHFQENPNKKLLIAGHDDTNGSAKQGFTISKLRAEGVLRLLEGDKSAWVTHAASNHTIKDYQQYLKYFHYTRGCNCDPGEINGQWGGSTEAAIRSYFSFVNQTGVLSEPLDIKMVTQNPGKLWPTEVWNHVYDVYEYALFSILIGSRWTPADAERERQRLSFVDPSKPYVACGESFPIDKVGKDNYRSQKNRRVEFLFFDDNTIPPLPLQCPSQTDKNHTINECPFYKTAYYNREYIKISDINSVVYHLKFTYFDRILNKWMDVPDGLYVKAFKAGKEVLTSCRSKNGIYYVRLLHISGGKRDDDVHFVIESKNAWVYTKDKSASPVLAYSFSDKAGTAITHEELAKRPLAERMHYYDLPKIWDSRNWFCKVDQKEGVFKTLVTEVTSVTAPMTFCLDAIILVKPGKKPNDYTQEIQDSDHFDKPKPIDPAKSRYKILYIDNATGNLELYKSGADASSSRIAFSHNFIMPPVKNTVIVLLGNDFYTIGSQRTLPENLPGQIVGARAAIMNAPGTHLKQTCLFNPANQDTEFGYTGDYELHYFHHLSLNSNHPTSYMVVFTSVAFMRDSRFPDVPAATKPPDQSVVDKFVNEGVYSAMEYWNKKRYFFSEEPETVDSTHVKLFYLVDERESFLVSDAKRPTSIDFLKKPHDLMTDKGGVKVARENAYGGKSKFLALIVNGNDAWQCALRNFKFGGVTLEYSLLKLSKESYHGITSSWTIKSVSEDGFTYKYFTFAHELGHAMGLPDEYIKRRELFPGGDRFPYKDQFFEPYTMEQNEGSMMYHNFAPRLHTTWYYLHRLNSSIVNASGSDSFETTINKLLTNKKFKARYKNGTDDYTYNWEMIGDNATHKNMRKPCYIEEKYAIPGTVDKSVYCALHHVSQDESSEKNFYNGQMIRFGQVLVVRLVFKYAFPITAFWTDNTKEGMLVELRDKFHKKCNKFYLKNNANLKRHTFLHFLIAIENAGVSNYTLSFTDDTTTSKEPISNPPAALPAGSPLTGIFAYSMHSNEISYTGRMPDAHVPLIQNLFVQAADKNAVLKLRDKTRSLDKIKNAGGTLTINRDVTMEEVVKYCLNIGADELVSLDYLKKWINDKTGEQYTLEKIV